MDSSITNRVLAKYIFSMMFILLNWYPIKAGTDNLTNTANNEYSFQTNKNVLVLNAYHEGFHWTDRIMQGIKVAFGKYRGVELFVNYMDTKRCSDSAYFEQLKDLYAHKYSITNFDAILATDDHALNFLLKYRDSVFPNVPVVFCGINDYKPSRIARHENYTGVYESYDVEGTLLLVLKLHPNTKEILFISDKTVSGEAFLNRINRIKDSFVDRVSFKYLTNLSPNDLAKELKQVSKDAVIVWSIYIRKPDGTVITSEESIRLVNDNTDNPVYCVWDVVGQGVVGGKITDPVYQGKRSSEIVLEILKGTLADEIEVEGSPLVYKFDYQKLIEFDISENNLPEERIVINKPLSFYEEYRNEIIIVISIISFLVLLVIVLIYLIQKQKHAKSEISEKNKDLEKTGLLLKENNIKLEKALEIARKSEELEKVNDKLLENEKIQKKLNEELRISNLTKDKFFAIIAHDLRSPFNSILGVTKILNKDFGNLSEEEQTKFLKILDKTVQNTFKLLENLLMWSRAQRGDIDFKPLQLNLYCLVFESFELVRQSANDKNLSFENFVSDSIIVNADKDMLLSIIRNLISNAIKFTPKGGKIEVKAKTTNNNNKEETEIMVKDSGIGIPEKVQTKLFDLGETTSMLGTEKETGTGLGLMLCKEFVEKHGGQIWVNSKEGDGSEFIFTIPN